MIELRDYHNFYLLTDVFLLANVFENFRGLCFQHYGHDPAHNYTSLGLSWQAALKMTNLELEFLTDIDQHLFIEVEIRGGVAMIIHRYAQTNAPGMEIYDDGKGNSYIMYLDANKLYANNSQPLPTSNFKWLTDKETEDLYVMIVLDDGLREYIL